MIQYRYNTQLQPPAPFVNLTLRNPADNRELDNVAAQLDSAADRTVLPLRLIESLGLAQIGTLTVGGLGGAVCTLPTYAVFVGIHNLPAQPFKVLAADEPWVLLGRDVINAHRLVLDGPQFSLEIG